MKRRSKKYLHLLGIAVVAFWVAMVALLLKKVHFKEPLPAAEHELSVKTVDAVQREWKEIYLGEEKAGYAVTLIKPFGEGYFIRDEAFLKLDLMGMGGGLYASTQALVDKMFFLKSFTLMMNSGIVRYKVTGKVENNVLQIDAGKGGGGRTRSIKLHKPLMLGVSMNQFFRSRKLRLGDIFRLPVFDPSTLAQKEAVVTVVSEEPVRIQRRTYEAFRLEVALWGKPVAVWVDKDGRILKEEGPMGLMTVRSSAARAPEGLEGNSGIDLYKIAAVRTNRSLPDPPRLAYLKLKIEGIAGGGIKPEALNGRRQRIVDGIMEIHRENLPSRGSYLIPYENGTGEMRGFLEPELNIESDDEEIKTTAGEIAGEDRDPVVVARKLLNWVYRKIEKKPVLSVPSALETLKRRVGDCNEHATLLAALLRASGIPARLCTGLVYSRENFYYHAWAEAYLDGWISMDATTNQMPADATHIKLVEGNLERQVEIAGLMGELQLEVIDFRHD